MTTASAFWDKVSTKYAASPIKDMDSYNFTLERTKSYLKSVDHALELGCGTGSTALLLAPHVRKITATDISGKMIELAKEKTWNASVKNAAFIQADVSDHATKDQVDVILAFNLLHLIERLPTALKRVADQLPKNGLFISKTPCLADGKWFFRPMVSIMQFFGKAPFVGFLEVTDLEREIEFAGFTIIETGSYPAKPPSRYIVARRD